MLSRLVISSFALLSLSLATPVRGDDNRGDYRDYRTDADRGNHDTVRCESESFSFKRCPVRTEGEVSLVRQLSDTPCRRGETWGFDRRGVWVDNGCAAEFAVGRREARRSDDEDRWYRGSGYQPGYRQPPTERGTIRCESEGYAFTRCRIRTGGDVRIVRQLSETPCQRGENWGFDRRGIWVDKGCAAEFAVAGPDPYYSYQR